MKKLLKKMFGYRSAFASIGRSAIILLVVLMVTSAISCDMADNAGSIDAAEFSGPKFVSHEIQSATQMSLIFSRKVELKDLLVASNADTNEKARSADEIQVQTTYVQDDDGKHRVNLEFSVAMKVGVNYILTACAVDENGNSVTISVPFTGYNSSVPCLEIVEIHSVYKGETKGDGKFKNEYVKIKANSQGNLSGIVFFTASYGEEKGYKFPSLEVTENEMIILHLRIKGEGCLSEMGSDLDASTAIFSQNGVRDLWTENTEKSFLKDDVDIAVLKNSVDGKLVDVVPYAKETVTKWPTVKTESFEAILGNAVENELWQSSNISDAVDATGNTPTKSLIKIANESNAASWKVDVAATNLDDAMNTTTEKQPETETKPTKTKDDDAAKTETVPTVANDDKNDDNAQKDGTEQTKTEEVDEKSNDTESATEPSAKEEMDTDTTKTETLQKNDDATKTVPTVANDDKNDDDNAQEDEPKTETVIASSVPVLEIVEIQIGYASQINDDDMPRCEYVKIKANKAMNLNGYEFFSVNYSKKYKFGDINVKKDESIILHLRKTDKAYESETENDLNASVSIYSENDVRDLWVGGKDKGYFRTESDIAVLQDSEGELIDVVPYAKNGITEWKSSKTSGNFAEILENAVNKGLWSSSNMTSVINASSAIVKSGEPLKAFVKTGTTGSADAWTVKTLK